MNDPQVEPWMRQAAKEIYEAYVEWRAFNPEKNDRIAMKIAKYAPKSILVDLQVEPRPYFCEVCGSFDCKTCQSPKAQRRDANGTQLTPPNPSCTICGTPMLRGKDGYFCNVPHPQKDVGELEKARQLKTQLAICEENHSRWIQCEVSTVKGLLNCHVREALEEAAKIAGIYHLAAKRAIQERFEKEMRP